MCERMIQQTAGLLRSFIAANKARVGTCATASGTSIGEVESFQGIRIHVRGAAGCTAAAYWLRRLLRLARTKAARLCASKYQEQARGSSTVCTSWRGDTACSSCALASSVRGSRRKKRMGSARPSTPSQPSSWRGASCTRL